MAHPVNWFQISGSDGKKLHAFYKKVFGWRMEPAPGPGDMMMVAPEQGGIPGGVGASMNGQPSVTVYVGVADVDAHLKKIEAAGGKSVMPRMELPAGMGFIAGFTDPGGNWVGLWAPGPGARPAKKARATKAKAKSAKARTAKQVPAKKASPARARARKKSAARKA